ncbi:MAG TPA: fused MFS/spermidine synthase [Pyrinomonadaceae bacterium]|nr:fused MFS/spermidine synthase [Pyrinomonadaceae bacterium]
MATLAAASESDPTHTYSPLTLKLVAACFFLSGATGLVYEVLWARMLGLVFGATTLAVSTVLAAFMGGLALGSALSGRIGASVKRPVRAYGLLEIGIALYALAVPLLFSLVDNLYAVIWQQFHPGFFAFSLWRFLLSCIMLLVPTTLMGATLPLLSAALLRSAGPTSTSITRLYTRNLAGAICGCVVAGFLLLPVFGVRATIYIAAVINILIGLVTILADRKIETAFTETGGASSASSDELTPGAIDSDNPREVAVDESERNARGPGKNVQAVESSNNISDSWFWLTCAFISGFVTISTQVAWTRMLTMIIGSSTYAFSIVVALFLVGLSGGAYVVTRGNFSWKLRETVLRIELFTAASLYLSLVVANKLPGLLVTTGLRLQISSWSGLLTLQILSVALLILLPAFLMGMVMPLVLVWAGTNLRNTTVQLVGRSYAVNTIGAIAGAFGAGFVLIPRFSTRFTILFAAALCIIVAGVAYQPKADARERDLQKGLAVGLTLVVIILMFIFSPRMNLADLSVGAYDSLVRVIAKTRGGVDDGSLQQRGPEIHELLMYEEGPTSTVSVRKDWDITSMAINGRTNASDREDMPTQVMLGQMPLLLAPRIRNALIVGYATGVTAGAMLQSPIESVECVELEPATVSGSHFFEHVNNHPLNDPRLHLIIDDARTYLRVTGTRYDMIVSEPSHPWVPGVANLFTREFFQLGRERLNDEGIFVQWLQIYQLSTDSLRSVLRTFHETFPHVLVFRVEGAWKGKDLLLVGSNTPLTLDRVKERISDPRITAELARVNVKSEADVRAWYVCDETKLAPAVADSVINTDDNMHIETTVPREAFRPLLETNAAWIESLK